MSEEPGPTVFVLFGATGDLSRRMVLPAFFTLAAHGLLPKKWLLVGNGRGDVGHEDFQRRVRDVLEEFGPHPDDGPWDEFCSRLRFAGGGFETSDPGSLLEVIGQARAELGDDAQLVHYLAIPPQAFGEVTRALGEHGLADGARVVYEKPFGTSQDAFRELDRTVHAVLDESQVYRIDHFLGKGRPRTCTYCVSATGCSTRCGTATTSAPCRSTCPRRSTSPTGPPSTSRPARCWTCW
jgi:glucose-6-phosphate 1-dehydrogenase